MNLMVLTRGNKIKKNKLKVCHISDTHDTYQDISMMIPSDVDIVFITGDMTYRGRVWELDNFVQQIKKIRKIVETVVIIPGNHELGCQKDEELWRKSIEETGAHFLIHESIQIKGINIFGSPWTPEFFNWAYNIQGGDEESLWDQIPHNTQILLTHGPPYGILDLCNGGHVGCKYLRNKIFHGLPVLKYHLFGHIHEGYGTREISGIFFSNASVMDGGYNFVNPPIIFEVEIK